jgi:hypothetical protein
MEVENSESIKELKLTAKWGIDNEEKKKAIFGLLQYGHEGASAIREILGVTAYADVKQACIDAIKSIGRKQMEAHHKEKNKGKKRKIMKVNKNKHSTAGHKKPLRTEKAKSRK